MNKKELLLKIADVQDLITSIYDCKTVSDKCETIIIALSELITVKTDIEAYYQFCADGAGE